MRVSRQPSNCGTECWKADVPSYREHVPAPKRHKKTRGTRCKATLPAPLPKASLTTTADTHPHATAAPRITRFNAFSHRTLIFLVGVSSAGCRPTTPAVFVVFTEGCTGWGCLKTGNPTLNERTASRLPRIQRAQLAANSVTSGACSPAAAYSRFDLPFFFAAWVAIFEARRRPSIIANGPDKEDFELDKDTTVRGR